MTTELAKEKRVEDRQSDKKKERERINKKGKCSCSYSTYVWVEKRHIEEMRTDSNQKHPSVVTTKHVQGT